MNDYDITVLEGQPQFSQYISSAISPNAHTALNLYRTKIRVADLVDTLGNYTIAINNQKIPHFNFKDMAGKLVSLPIHAMRGYYLDDEELLPIIDLTLAG